MKTIWRLKAKHDQRFRGGHPWVYSNEIQSSPADIVPGAAIELQDASGKFLARGYGSPRSLISFRVLSRDPEDLAPWDLPSLEQKLLRALRIRERLGMGQVSARLLFGEADGFPGLILDRYRAQDGEQAFVFQPQTAGADRLCETLLPNFEEILKKAAQQGLDSGRWEGTTLILRQDARSREREGLTRIPAKIIQYSRSQPNLKKMEVSVFDSQEFFFLEVDLLEGQKTGYFLDQAMNLALAGQVFLPHAPKVKGESFRILDLCCYLGQWGISLARRAQALGYQASVLAVDRSEKALALAQANLKRNGITGKTLQAELPDGFSKLEEGAFDLVICDPPALIQSRKDLPQGKRAYLQWNTHAFERLRPLGGFISCSCSGLLSEDEFFSLTQQAFERSRLGARGQQGTLRWVARGGQSPDHPVMGNFPEGRYLKCGMGMVDV